MKKLGLVYWIRTHAFIVAIGVILAIDIFLTLVVFSHRNLLRVSFLDVGQGDAVFVQAPNGNQLLYDAGPPTGTAIRALSHVMPFWARSIDVAVFSHPDMDHIGGFPEIFKRYEIGVALEPGVGSNNGVYTTAEQAIVTEKAGHILARGGMSIELGGGVFADILYPDRDTTGMETNSASIVMRIRYGKTAFLVSGDLPQAQEDLLTGVYGEQLHADVLKLGHHGSRTSSSQYWLSAIHPATAVISSGKHNRYGHPHKEVLELLQKMNIPYLNTADVGTISFESDGDTVSRK